MADRTLLRPRKPVTMGSFLVVALVTAALFVPTFSGHLAVMNTVSIDATATDVAMSEDGDQLVVQIRIHNPTRAAFTASYGQLFGKVEGTQLTGTGNEVEETTVPAGETRTLTARISVPEEHRDRAARAAKAGNIVVTGQLDGRIRDQRVEVEVTEETDG
ncbi:DUF916 domain-containing protein [Halorussus gelatinilyticus]|uniref:DUF916 domain-containing protein n=1 Tax=Halorussus gelatinilyticus TaxID=2937524 RepID=A0A8U0IHA1_9EURY|nr:DUF916 domain-containing protein [Halorussus gelatinilyticus]UPV99631.1 DUF916 domain-containing protein [Halorussus gelatinilyticus]